MYRMENSDEKKSWEASRPAVPIIRHLPVEQLEISLRIETLHKDPRQEWVR